MAARKTHRVGPVVVTEPCGPDGLDLLRTGLSAALAADTPEIIVDVSAADRIDGACLAALMQVTGTLPAGHSLSLIANPGLADSLREWRFETVLGIVDTDADQRDDSGGV